MEGTLKCAEENKTSIYDDLIHQGDLGLQIHNLQAKNKQLQNHVVSLEDDVQKLCNRIKEMKQTQDNLSRNISELFKTAKCEIARKDRLIAELQAKVDDMIFRRNTSASNFSAKRHYEDTDENSVKRYKYNDRPDTQFKTKSETKCENDRHSSDRSTKSFENRSNKSIEKSHKTWSSRDENRKESSKNDRHRRRSKSRDNERRNRERDSRKFEDRNGRRDRSKEYHKLKDHEKNKNRDNKDSQAKPCVSSKISTKVSLQLQCSQPIVQLEFERSSPTVESRKPIDQIDSKQSLANPSEEAKNIQEKSIAPKLASKVEVKSVNIKSQSKSKKKVDADKLSVESRLNRRGMDLESRQSSAKPLEDEKSVEPKFTSKVESKQNTRIQLESTKFKSRKSIDAEEKSKESEQIQAIIDLEESREEGEISDDFEKESQNARVSSLRKSTLAIRSKVSPKDEKLKKDRSQPIRADVSAKQSLSEKMELSKSSEEAPTDTANKSETITKKKIQKKKNEPNMKKKDDPKKREKKSNVIDNKTKEKTDKMEEVSEEMERKTEKITILSQVLIQEAETISKAIIDTKNDKTQESTETKISETKLEDTTKKQLSRINPPLGGVPRNLTNELDINLNKDSNQMVTQKDIIQLEKIRSMASLFDTPVKSTNFDKSEMGLTHEGTIPTLQKIESMNSKESKKAKATSTPVTEFQIFKSNLASSEIAKSLQFENDEKMGKSDDFTKTESEEHENAPKQMVKNESIGYGNTAELNISNWDLLNAHFGNYRPEDFPNLTAVSIVEKEPHVTKTKDLNNTSTDSRNLLKDLQVSSSDEKGTPDVSAESLKLEPRRKRRRCIMKWSE